MITWIKKILGVTNSELMAYSTLIIWVTTVLFSFLSMLLWDKDTGFILISVSGTFGVTLSAYMLKATTENKNKYNKTEDNSKIEQVVKQVTDNVKEMTYKEE